LHWKKFEQSKGKPVSGNSLSNDLQNGLTKWRL